MPTAAVQGTHGCLMLLAQVLQNHQTWAWTTLKYYDILISCCLPFRFIHSCAYSVHSRDGRCLWLAFLQLVRFPDSPLRFLLQVLECHKSGNATSQAISFLFFKEMFKPNCGKTIQDSHQVLPNSNSCLGEPGLKFFGFACTSLTLLVGVLTVFTISWPELEVAGQPISR